MDLVVSSVTIDQDGVSGMTKTYSWDEVEVMFCGTPIKAMKDDESKPNPIKRMPSVSYEIPDGDAWVSIVHGLFTLQTEDKEIKGDNIPWLRRFGEMCVQAADDYEEQEK